MKPINLKHWVSDYLRLAQLHGHSVMYRKPPEHYLGFIKAGKRPVIIIPGVTNSWQAMVPIADTLSKKGHPIYVVEGLGHNIKTIPEGAKIVDRLLADQKLRGAVIVAHSKGGLLGKQLLMTGRNRLRVKRLIAIASPFSGSDMAKLLPVGALGELAPNHKNIRKLAGKSPANRKITSIYGVFDNHVWPLSSSHLDGAKNVQVKVHGHHAILFDKKTKLAVLKEIKELDA